MTCYCFIVQSIPSNALCDIDESSEFLRHPSWSTVISNWSLYSFQGECMFRI